MGVGFNFKISKYHKVEVLFFLVYFYGIGLLSSFEYNFWEKDYVGISVREVEFALVYGTCEIIAFFIFYKALQYCLRKNKLWSFIVLIVLFLTGYYFYNKACYLLISHLDFLSYKIRSDALTWYHAKRLGYTVHYMMIHLFGVAFLAYFINSARQNEQLRALKEQQLISELTYLKAQIQPHFFFNTLNNIYSLALLKAEETAPLVARLAEMMRYILYKADERLVLLKDEVAFIRNYVEIENIRYRSAINIKFDVQGIDEKSQISPLLLLPFIENAFKHGVQEEEKEGYVNIIICKVEQELILEVKNSIAKTRGSNGGIGLENVKKRLEILYHTKYKLEMHNDGEFYHVSLTLQMK
ncbi:sensor histidine kinase [Ferruginibacter sp. HRS2-29]|uniref:sensor histidine kinase n=1 Tax=Ferruginibacter sp. HRS2-29 TaxID=2487334 RepID=UPI0020CE8A57|nr:histidine kinase [Ferruginibacter sp. HRS2-29]MCP9752614.1 hypothetical protein [Ferruginibacter sp. HRS2-29]